MSVLRAADLFCGAGGSSTGLQQAAAALGCRVDLTAVNHWPVAVETHAANHPDARHVCESLDSIDPRKVTGGALDLLWASPECTHHSTARGGRPINDQSRSTAWHVLRWAEALRPRWVLVENVPEFQTWGPIGSKGRPLASRKGETFLAWLAALRSLGYAVEYRVLNAADYGAATTRRRLFVVARRGRGGVVWPEATHAPADAALSLFGALPAWRGAREVIDWSKPGRSIFRRERPLAQATLARIEDGLRRFGGAPFLLGQQSGAVARLVSEPLPTIATSGAISLIQPFLITYYGSGANVQAVTAPLRTITTKDRFGLVRAEGGDITLRMLDAGELARGMGFSDDYHFAGTQAERKVQIGNAVEVNQARALWTAPVADVAGVEVAA